MESFINLLGTLFQLINVLCLKEPDNLVNESSMVRFSLMNILH